jgi:hypothetical protein
MHAHDLCKSITQKHPQAWQFIFDKVAMRLEPERAI